MNFKLKRNEIILISVLGLLLYAFVLYKFVWVPVVPEIREQKDHIEQLQSDKDKLDSELQNIDLKRIELNSKQAGDERLEGYLNNETNVTDCIEYMGKLADAVDSDITDVNISVPEKKEVNNSQYYEIKIDFTTTLNINKIKDMLSYIENSSKLMKIGRFQISKEKAEKQNIIPVMSNKLFKTNLSLNMYALNIEAADKLYEYGRHKFNRYEYGDAAAFEASDINGISNIQDNDGTNTAVNSKDFEINFNSFLTAGDNFILFGFDKSEDKLTLKTNKYITMELSIGNNSYLINALDSSGKKYGLTGAVPNRDLNMWININLSQIQENKNIGLKIKVINNSGNKLNVTMDDAARRVILTDRQGKEIYDGSQEEKVYIR